MTHRPDLQPNSKGGLHMNTLGGAHALPFSI